MRDGGSSQPGSESFPCVSSLVLQPATLSAPLSEYATRMVLVVRLDPWLIRPVWTIPSAAKRRGPAVTMGTHRGGVFQDAAFQGNPTRTVSITGRSLAVRCYTPRTPRTGAVRRSPPHSAAFRRRRPERCLQLQLDTWNPPMMMWRLCRACTRVAALPNCCAI